VTDAPEIFAAMAAVMADVKAVGKDDVNSAQNFRFRGIDGVLNAVGPALRTHRVVVVPMVEQVDVSTVEVGKNRTPMAHVSLRVRYRFLATDGSSVDAVVPAEAFDSGDKAVSKAMSVAFRTALIQSLTLPTNEPDPDSVLYERAPAHDAGPGPEPAPDRFVDLKVATNALTDPAPVVDWVKAEGITRRTLTDEVADEWARRIEEAAKTPMAVPSGEDPF
jgi:hypothetical protein